MELPFTLNKKHANTNVKFNFLKVPFWTPEKVRFWFYKTTPQKHFSLCLGFDSALKTIDTQNVLLISIFENAQKKLLTVKNTILAVFEC